MGLFGSSEERIDEKVIDTAGNVNNNIIIQEARDTHDQVRINEKMLHTMYLMCGIEIAKLIIYAFHRFKKSVKKRYSNQQDNA